MILMGVLMFTGKMNDITGYLSTTQESASQEGSSGEENKEKDVSDDSGVPSADDADGGNKSQGTSEDQESAGQDSENQGKTAAYDFELTDQYGKTHRLSDYKGKVIFLNFWATWCPPCRAEMPDIQKLYEEYAARGEDAEVVILGAAAPGMGQEGSEEEIGQFMQENGYTYPVLMDTDWEMFSWYGINSFPTTFMIDRDGNIFGYVPGQMTEEIMRSIIDQTLEG